MTLTHLIAIPAAPVTVPGVTATVPADILTQVKSLRAAIDDTLDALPRSGTVLLIDAGPESVVHDATRASLAGYGYPEVTADLRVDTGSLVAVSARGQAPRVRSDHLSGDLATLALLVAAARPDLAIAPVTIPASAGARALEDVAMGLQAAIAGVPRQVVVIAVGDLAATLHVTSPGYYNEDAAGWDQQAVDAFGNQDVARFSQLGPVEAERVQARGWAPLTVGLHLASHAGLSVDSATYLTCRGVGRLVAVAT